MRIALLGLRCIDSGPGSCWAAGFPSSQHRRSCWAAHAREDAMTAVAPYGSWESPIDAALVAGGGTTPLEIQVDGDVLWWLEQRPAEDGRQVAPWDGTELWVADLSVGDRAAWGGPVLREARRVAGGPEESVCQPAWDPAGDLHFISDRTGWWNLYEVSGEVARGGQAEAEPLAPMAAEFAIPQWWFGLSGYAFLPDGRIACAYGRGPVSHLGLLAPRAGRVEPLALDAPFTSFAWLRALGSQIACVAGGPSAAPAVVLADPASGRVEIVRRGREPELEPAFISVPR